MENLINMKESGGPNRLYALDVSRGFASLAVVLWHWQHFVNGGASLSNILGLRYFHYIRF